MINDDYICHRRLENLNMKHSHTTQKWNCLIIFNYQQMRPIFFYSESEKSGAPNHV